MSFLERFRKQPEIAISAEVRSETQTDTDAERFEALNDAREDYQRSQSALDAYIVTQHGPSPTDGVQLAPPSVCPNCGTVFESPISRSKKCPECQAKIVLRTIDGSKYALTPEMAEALDERKKLVAKYRASFRRVQNIGASVQDFITTLDSLGPSYGPRDASWRMLNDEAINSMRIGDFHRLAMAYHLQAIQLHDENRDPFQILGFAREAELARYRKDEVVERVEILGCNCVACAPDSGRRLQWNEFQPGQFGLVGPLPHKDCDRGLCPCSYAPVTRSLDFIDPH